MCAALFCVAFKEKYPCVNGKWDHDFGGLPDEPLPGAEEDLATRTCVICTLIIWIEEYESNYLAGDCPFAYYGAEQPLAGPTRQ